MESIKLITETKFKQTEIDEIPEDWNVVKLGEVVQEFKKKNITNNLYPVYSISNIHGFIRSEDFFDKKVYSENLKNYKVVEKNYFAYNPYRVNVGSIGLFCEETQGLVSSAYITFKIKDENTLLPLFLLNIVKSQTYISEIFRISCSRGSVRRSLAFRDLCDIPIPLPPLSEQQKIAAVLSAVQEAKEKTEAVIDTTKALKKSMMKHLFTYGPVPPEEVENVPLKETEIGKVPEEWEVVKLGDLSTKKLIKVQFGFPCGKWNDKGIGIAQVRPFNINENGNIDLTVLKYIETDNDISKYLLQKEDIIFNNTNSEDLVGKTAFWKDGKIKYVLSNHMTIIRIVDKSKLNAYFLAKYLHKRWNDGFYKTICRRHVNQSSISLARLNDIALPLPPLSVQQRITSILSTIDAKIEAEENKKQALEELFKTVLHNLMTAKIRVNNLEIKV